jgi:NAD(P)-dependent dehydrogenase (short-subunit alcohol dehydrogenase family)
MHALEVLSDALRVESRPFGSHVVVVQPGAIKSEWAGISANNVMKTSKGSAYSAQIEPMAQALTHYDNAANPDVIAAAVSKAVNSTRPRRRYATPMDAKMMMFLRRWLPDWAWERLVQAAMKRFAKGAGPLSKRYPRSWGSVRELFSGNP